MGGGSSLKHCVKRRVHLERATPEHLKAKYGTQEHAKQFKKRAQQLKEAKKVLQNLSLNARVADKDEFRFAMKSSKLVEGKVVKLSKKTEPANLKKKGGKKATKA